MDSVKNVLDRTTKWQELMKKYDDFFYADDGIFTATLIDPDLTMYNLDFDIIKDLIRKLKDYEEEFGELYKDEKEALLRKKELLLTLKNSNNAIDEIYRKMSNMYYFIEDY